MSEPQDLGRVSKPGVFQALLSATVVWAVLLICFSPPWFQFRAWLRVPELGEVAVPIRRGELVLRQLANPGYEITDPIHKILQWRLLIPLLGNILHLPGSVVLALAPLGCWFVLFLGIQRLCREGLPILPGGTNARLSRAEAVALAIACGASAWFFTSTSWLGYYDSLIVLGLLATAFSHRRWPVIAACLLGPWIDERFFLGFPLAMTVRWMTFSGGSDRKELFQWLKRDAFWPAIVVFLGVVTRIALLGAHHSSTMESYFSGNGAIAFVEVTDWRTALERLLFGSWAGLRVGWVAILLGISSLAWRQYSTQAIVMAVAAVFTTLVGLATANDLSRSTLLLAPLVPLGWSFARGLPYWGSRNALFILAGITLSLPAHQVVTDYIAPVHGIWTEWQNLADPAEGVAQNTLGRAYATGNGVKADLVVAARWYRRAAEQNYAPAQFNLAICYLEGHGIDLDKVEAVKWLRLAGAQNYAPAEYNLGIAYATGLGVEIDYPRAVKWFRQAADQNHAEAEGNLGVCYYNGRGLAVDKSEAMKWYRRAAEHGYPQAQYNLAVAYAKGDGVPLDQTEAAKWCRRAAYRNHPQAQSTLGLCFYRGLGVKKDYIQAAAWLSLAEKAGDSRAAHTRLEVERELNPEDKAAAVALADRLSREVARTLKEN